MIESPENHQEKLDIKIRPATPEDWQDYKKIRLMAVSGQDAHAFGRGAVVRAKAKTDEEWKADLEDKNSFFILAWEGSEIMGMGRAIDLKDDGAWWINAVYTKEDSRGEIPPTKALKIFKDEIKRRGGKRVELGVMASNPRAKRLYRALGFTEVIRKIGDDDQPIPEFNQPAIVMGMDLDAE